MRVVLDTNILVSGLLQPEGVSGRVLDIARGGHLTLLYDPRVMAEYRDVLGRPRFGFRRDSVEALLATWFEFGEAISCLPLAGRFPDPDDVKFIEVAVTGRAEAIVTGNARHYPRQIVRSVRVLAPSEFLTYFADSVLLLNPFQEK